MIWNICKCGYRTRLLWKLHKHIKCNALRYGQSTACENPRDAIAKARGES